MLIRGVQEDTYSYGLRAQPGGYVGRAVTTPGSWPIGQLARPLSPDQPTNPGSGGRILPPKPARHLHHASYDDVYRLTREQRSGTGAFDITYTRDPVGNRSAKLTGGAMTTYSSLQYR